MTFLGWMAIGGTLLLLMALSSAFLRRLPISTSIVYLAVGAALGPLGAGQLQVDVRLAAPWLERLTEVAVIISLFIGGLKLRAPPGSRPWRGAFVLAGPVMLLSIAGVAAVAHFGLGLAAAPALLLGAILAPTDPVLASAVAVSDASDRDRMRFSLSGEAGLNDGMAFPFVVFALLWGQHGGPGAWMAGWAAHRLLWAVPAALAIGYVAGLGVGRVAIALRRGQQDDAAPNDLLAMALIALSYVIADVAGAWGFLAAFAAGVGLRAAELKVVSEHPHPEVDARMVADDRAGSAAPHPPAEELVPAALSAQDLDQPAVAAGVLVSETLSFGGTAERLLEVMLIVLVGAALASHWDLRAVPVALALFFVIRPAAVWLCLARARISRKQRLLLGWFGIRGIGSLYYLAYVTRSTPETSIGADVTDLTISVVALSVLLHGVSSRPLLARYQASPRNSGPARRAAAAAKDVSPAALPAAPPAR